MAASQVAKITRIPPAQAAKILHYLGWRGFTRARRGPNGGYVLCGSPEEIHVGQVTKLFQPATRSDFKPPADPVLRIWMQKFAKHLKDWEELTIAELSRRTAGQWKFPPRGKDRSYKA